MADEVHLSEREQAELCAFADGTLAQERRAEVAAWVAASPELRALVERQRRSLGATAVLANEPVPSSLTAAVERRRRARATPSRSRLGFALAALAVAVAVLAVLTVNAGPGGPSVAEIAGLASQAPSGPAPAAAGPGRLDVSVEGLSFPDYSSGLGWTAIGLRRGSVGGRDATVVYYEKGGSQVAYAIVARPALPPPETGRVTTLGGVHYRTLPLHGRPAVTWRQGGHTCVITGSVPAGELLALASWGGAGAPH
jgi:anti-sigma factor RsiW